MSKIINFNPYVTGQPIKEPHRFFGRQKILKDIFNRLLSSPDQNVLLIHGQRRIGKSSLLFQVVSRINEKHKDLYIPIVIDLLGSSDVRNILLGENGAEMLNESV